MIEPQFKFENLEPIIGARIFAEYGAAVPPFCDERKCQTPTFSPNGLMVYTSGYRDELNLPKIIHIS